MKGRKRHIVVDILGNLLYVQVHAAHLHDTVGGCEVLRRATEKHPSLEAFSGDAGYRGTAVRFVEEQLTLALHSPKKSRRVSPCYPSAAGWSSGRSPGWAGFRRLSKDLEILTATAKNRVHIALLKITLAKCF